MAGRPRTTRPLIGVTGPDHGGTAAWWFSRLAVYRAGGRAVRLTPGTFARRELTVGRGTGRALDGLILGGGADVAPRLYGAELREIESAAQSEGQRSVSRYLLALGFYPLLWLLRKLLSRPRGGRGDTGRDEFEMGLLAQALAQQRPVLGICRGAQLLNVHFGGTLHQDLSGFYVESPQLRTVLPRQWVRLEPDSCLARILGTTECAVNALHTQAVNQLGAALRVAARERSGVIQAIEHKSRPFLLGVQWHPEYLPQLPRQQAIFRALVQAAAGLEL